MSGGLFGAALAGASGLLGLALLSTTENGTVFLVGPLLGLVLAAVVMSWPSTRWWGVGMLIGFFLALVTLGGACVALIAVTSG